MIFPVTAKAMRPASTKKECFYCHQLLGMEHLTTCVLRQKKVTVRAIIMYEVGVPAHWTEDDILFHRNESSWCASNMLRELEKLEDNGGCLCPHVEYEYISDSSSEYLEEV